MGSIVQKWPLVDRYADTDTKTIEKKIQVLV